MDVFEEEYNKLNREQKQAVDTIDGPVMVIAGPGSGKTQILALRVARILKETDTPAHAILCLTFTEKAASNTRERLAGIIGTNAYHVHIMTFHGFATHLIDRYPEYFYDGARLVPAGDVVQHTILSDIFANLLHDDPLSSIHDGSYVYLSDTKRAISDLKRAGVAPEDFVGILEENKKIYKLIKNDVDSVFSPRVSKKTITQLKTLHKRLEDMPRASEVLPHFLSFSSALATSLARVIENVEEMDSPNRTLSPASEWKQRMTVKDGSKRILKEIYHHEKLLSLARIYEKYDETLHQRGYFDYEDMILDAISALKSNETFHSIIQEQYQYILIDEFQDTNDAQMQLVELMTDSALHEGRPNIMAVGDDDQAIYRFQGAEVANLLSFDEKFADPVRITMTKNYRSTQDILDVARAVIIQGTERLENLLGDIDKSLEAVAGKETPDAVESIKYPTQLHEFAGVSKQIKKMLQGGVDPAKIAVIGRRHRDLEQLVPFMHKEHVPIRYERQQNVFLEPHIRELVSMIRVVDALATNNAEAADIYLPTVISAPFWGLDRVDVWDISLEAQKRGISWIETMQTCTDNKIRSIAQFFISVSQKALHEPVEYVLEGLIGAHIPLIPDDEVDDISGQNMHKGEFVSPFKDYYFSQQELQNNRDVYIRFLSGLQAFVRALREYQAESFLTVSDLVEFIDVYENNEIVMTDTSAFVASADSVVLLSAHAAKGLEFEHVFVISCQEDIWARTSSRNLLHFPLNLPIAPSVDNTDDALRLFYVALTRAKETLHLSSFASHDSGKDTLPVSFLHADSALQPKESEKDVLPDIQDLLEVSVPRTIAAPYIEDEKALLLPRVEHYAMSVTHMLNFLDVTRGGPHRFLEQNLLRFPQPLSLPGIYGSVMHATLHDVYTHLKAKKRRPTLKYVEKVFEEKLSRARMSSRDMEYYRKKGLDALSVFYPAYRNTFKPQHLSEYNFKHKHIMLKDDTHITGIIDVIETDKEHARVYDWKTGKVYTKWSAKTPQLWRYRMQLIFYKLLVEQTDEFKGLSVDRGTLIFIEPHQGNINTLSLKISDEETRKVAQIAQVVYHSIISLNFPDTSQYSADMDGINTFMDDLLEGRV